jgi:hypothetical protein
MSSDQVSQDELIVGGLAALLIFDLLFLTWSSITVGSHAQSISLSSTATGSPDGWLGVLGLLAAIALLVDVILTNISPSTQLPALKGSRAATQAALALTATGLLAFKFLLHLGSAGGFGFWVAVLLCGGLVYVTHRVKQLDAAKR